MDDRALGILLGALFTLVSGGLLAYGIYYFRRLQDKTIAGRHFESETWWIPRWLVSRLDKDDYMFLVKIRIFIGIVLAGFVALAFFIGIIGNILSC